MQPGRRCAASVASLLFVQPRRCKSLIIHDAIAPLDMRNSSEVPLTTFFQLFDVPEITRFCFAAIRFGGNHYSALNAALVL